MDEDQYSASRATQLENHIEKFVFLNDVIEGEVLSAHSKIVALKKQNRYMMSRLARYEQGGTVEFDDNVSDISLSDFEDDNKVSLRGIKTTLGELVQKIEDGRQQQASSALKKVPAPLSKPKMKETVKVAVGLASDSVKKPIKGSEMKGKEVKGKEEKKKPSRRSRPKVNAVASNVRRRKAANSVIKRAPSIPLDADGNPQFPITLGGLRIYSIGKIVPKYHSERHFWPIGWKSTRSYPSMKYDGTRTSYTCEILESDSGEDFPVFRITGKDCPDEPVFGSSASKAHCKILQRINETRGKAATNVGSGPEFFGFGHPSIVRILQAMPGAAECSRYIQRKFLE
eukprot:Nk52_evm82s1810 gene=Nk52_evmTU82s1810